MGGEANTWNTMNTDHKGHTPVQNDNRNCVNISLGYLDSLIKQIASIKQNLKPGEKLSVELWKQIHSFCAVEIPKNLKMPGSNEETNTILLPAKYIKYLQSMRSADALIAESKKSENKDNIPLQQVAVELIRVKE